MAAVADPKPRRRRDGTYVCAVCGCVLNAVTIRHGDPFCCVVHAQDWHGTAEPPKKTRRDS